MSKARAAAYAEPWPLGRLRLATPRLELRPDDDDGLRELVEVARRGFHPPEDVPLLIPWADASPGELGSRMLRYFWQQRAVLTPQRWSLHFLVRRRARVIGMQALTGRAFGVAREVGTYSILGMPHQGKGFGTEMRAAVLQFAFDHLGAERARSTAFEDNLASLRVSEKLGYQRNGTLTVVRGGAATTELQLVLSRNRFARPDWTVRVEGLDRCLTQLVHKPVRKI